MAGLYLRPIANIPERSTGQMIFSWMGCCGCREGSNAPYLALTVSKYVLTIIVSLSPILLMTSALNSLMTSPPLRFKPLKGLFIQEEVTYANIGILYSW